MVEIVLITGHLGTGKTHLAERLHRDHGFHMIRTSHEIRRRFDLMNTNMMGRSELQKSGAQWDDQSDGKWLFEIVKNAAADHARIVVDHVRNELQLKHFRNHPEWRTLHVHLYAPRPFLEEQYGPKLKQENISYE